MKIVTDPTKITNQILTKIANETNATKVAKSFFDNDTIIAEIPTKYDETKTRKHFTNWAPEHLKLLPKLHRIVIGGIESHEIAENETKTEELFENIKNTLNEQEIKAIYVRWLNKEKAKQFHYSKIVVTIDTSDNPTENFENRRILLLNKVITPERYRYSKRGDNHIFQTTNTTTTNNTKNVPNLQPIIIPSNIAKSNEDMSSITTPTLEPIPEEEPQKETTGSQQSKNPSLPSSNESENLNTNEINIETNSTNNEH